MPLICKFISFWVFCSDFAKVRSKTVILKISKPISPLNAGQLPWNKNCFSEGLYGYNLGWSDRGVSPLSGWSPNCPKPQILRFFAFSTNFPRNDFQFFTACRNARIESAVLATAIPSVCPSVRLSVTCWYCVKTTARSTVQFALSDSKMCLVL